MPPEKDTILLVANPPENEYKNGNKVENYHDVKEINKQSAGVFRLKFPAYPPGSRKTRLPAIL